MPVRTPLRAAVVEIEHGGHRVHAQPVHAELLQPPERGGEQETPHLGPAEVEHPRAPAVVFPLERIGVLIETRPVEVHQPVRVLAEVRGHPVEDHGQPRRVQAVDEILQVVGRSVARCRREVARTLVAPRVVERVLRHRQQLHAGVAHVAHIARQLLGQLPVRQEPPVLPAPPRAEVYLVDVHRPLRQLPPLRLPAEAREVKELARRLGAGLAVYRVGVRLPADVPVGPGHDVFVAVKLLRPRHEALPQAVLSHHRQRLPAAEIPREGNIRRVRRPHAEAPSVPSAAAPRMGAHLAVCPAPCAGAELLYDLIHRLLSSSAAPPGIMPPPRGLSAFVPSL